MAYSWLTESYLEALTRTLTNQDQRQDPSIGNNPQWDISVSLPSKAEQLYTKYYVNQLLSLDEGNLRDAYMKVARTTESKQERLAYLSWRVWGMKRKQAKTAQISAGNSYADSDISDSEKDELMFGSPAELASDSPLPTLMTSEVAQAYNEQDKLAAIDKLVPLDEFRLESVSEAVLEDDTLTGNMPVDHHGMMNPAAGAHYYVVLCSLHGLVRGERLELGCDPDTGGQVKYVVELAKALAAIPRIARVDVVTRLIADPKVDASYSVPCEQLVPGDVPNHGAYIIRLPAGPPEKYIRKEELWPHVREFSDALLTHVSSTLKSLALLPGAHPVELLGLHGHYADAGEVCCSVAATLGAAALATGHSLGRNKRAHLLGTGRSAADIEQTYKLGRRIEAEERMLDGAVLIVASTQQEIKEQWGEYDGYSTHVEKTLSHRPRRGYSVPTTVVIPPGIDFTAMGVTPPANPWTQPTSSGGGGLPTIDILSANQDKKQSAPPSPGSGSLQHSPFGSGNWSQEGSALAKASSPTHRSPQPPTALPFVLPPIWSDISRWLRSPGKPMVLTLCRPDAKKNVVELVKAFGSNRLLRELANLVLVLGNRDAINSLAPGARRIMMEVFQTIDDYDLWGSVAVPKHHHQSEVVSLYSLAAATRGVFVNVALQEPFGLTLIEAAAVGLPVVATCHGGPVDIIATLHHGVLVEPTDSEAIANALTSTLTDTAAWDEYSASGRKNIVNYSWPVHCVTYLNTAQDQLLRAVPPAMYAVQALKKSHSLSVSSLTHLLSRISVGTNASPCLYDDGLMDASSETPPKNSNFGGPMSAVMRSIRAALAGRRSPALMAASMPQELGDALESLLTTAPAAKEGTTVSSTERGLSSVSMPTTPVVEPTGTDSDVPDSAPIGSRDALMVFTVDTASEAEEAALLVRKQVTTAAEVVETVKTADRASKEWVKRKDWSRERTGYGVISTLSCKAVSTLLEEAGLSVGDFDFIACHSGAQLWILQQKGGTDIVYEEAYEKHIEWRWEDRAIQQALQRLVGAAGPMAAQRKGLTLSPSYQSGRHRSGKMMTAFAPIAEVTHTGKGPKFVAQDKHTEGGALSPAMWILPEETVTYHTTLEFSLTQSASVDGVSPVEKTVAPATALSRLQKRLRRQCMRVNLLALPAPNDSGLWRIHVTPIRSSRSLVLRYVSHVYGIPLEDCTMVTCALPANEVDAASGASPWLLPGSDGEELVGGLQHVVLLPSGAYFLRKASGSTVDTSVYTPGRVLTVKS